MTFSDSSVIESKTVIYAAGASPRRADIPGEKEYAGKGVSYCAICDGSFYRGKKVAVLGGGDTALDDAGYLAGLAEQVYVIHRRKEFRGAVVTVEKLKRKRECHVCTGTSGERNHRKSESDRCCSGRRNSNRCRWRIRSLRIGSADGTGKGSGGTGFRQLTAKADETEKPVWQDCMWQGDARTKKLRQVVTAVSDEATQQQRWPEI